MAYLPLIPFVNATVTAIKGGGTSEDYDQAPGAATTKWSGTTDAWLGENVKVEVGTDRNVIEEDRIQFARSDVASTDIEPGDTITYSHDGSTTVREVREIHNFDTVGVVRLTFADV